MKTYTLSHNINVSKNESNFDNIKILPILYIIVCVFSFITTSNIANISFNYWFKYLLAIFWILICLIRIAKKNLKLNTIFRWYLYLILPFIIMILTMPIMYLFNNQTITLQVLSRSFSFFFQRNVILLCSILSAVLFKNKCIKYTFISLVISYMLYIIFSIYKFGLNNFFDFLFTAYSSKWNEWQSGTSISSYLETHDITFSFGFFFLYFFFFYKGNNKFLYVFLSFICVWLGFKRIEILSLILTSIIYVFLKKSKKENILKKKTIFVLTIFILFLLSFVYIVGDGELINLANKYDINFNGRLENYAILANFYDFSIFYVGKGYCYTSLLVENMANLEIVHSDILKSYIDYGFIGFILWISYYMYMLPFHFGKKLNRNNESKNLIVMVVIFSCYAMINYVTDNVNNYFIFQIIYMLIPLSIFFSLSNQSTELNL